MIRVIFFVAVAYGLFWYFNEVQETTCSILVNPVEMRIG